MRTEDVFAQIDDALDDWQVGPDAMRCNAPAGTTSARTTPRPPVYIPGSVFVRIVADTSRWEAAMRRFVEVMTDISEKLAGVRRDLSPHDAHQPRPLAIDGAAYRRRVRNRRQR